MGKRKLWTLIAAPGLAVTGLLLTFLLLGWNPAGASVDIPPHSASLTVSGTVTCQATGPISDVEVALWNWEKSSVVTSDTTGINGTYSVTLDEGTYYLEFLPPAATGLHAKAHTTLELITDTVLDADFCICSGVWVSETVDSAGNVGAYTSLALEPTYPYAPHISYRDVTSARLKYAYLSGTTWFSETVDAASWTTSLALAPTYPHTPAISYDGRDNHTWFACLSGTTWISKIVPGPYAGDPSLALEPAYPHTPHMSYFWSLGTAQTLYHAYLSGTTCVSGTWDYEEVEPPYSQAGRESSLALESTDPYTPHISYRYRIGDSDLRYAWLSGTIWLTETVDSAGDVGKLSSLALDRSGNPHISYLDDTNNAVKYAWLSGTTWFSETVDNIGEPPYGGGHSSLGLDQSDLPYITYYDVTHGDLKLARFDGKTWIMQTVDSEEDVGSYNSLALDPRGCPHISYYDTANGDLKYAYIPPRYYVYLPLVMRNDP